MVGCENSRVRAGFCSLLYMLYLSFQVQTLGYNKNFKQSQVTASDFQHCPSQWTVSRSPWTHTGAFPGPPPPLEESRPAPWLPGAQESETLNLSMMEEDPDEQPSQVDWGGRHTSATNKEKATSARPASPAGPGTTAPSSPAWSLHHRAGDKPLCEGIKRFLPYT